MAEKLENLERTVIKAIQSDDFKSRPEEFKNVRKYHVSVCIWMECVHCNPPSGSSKGAQGRDTQAVYGIRAASEAEHYAQKGNRRGEVIAFISSVIAGLLSQITYCRLLS